jgi:hypothetical protein
VIRLDGLTRRRAPLWEAQPAASVVIPTIAPRLVRFIRDAVAECEGWDAARPGRLPRQRRWWTVEVSVIDGLPRAAVVD